MDNIIKPQWDKSESTTMSGGYGANTIIGKINIGMNADAKHKSDHVKIKITAVNNNTELEGVIIDIKPKDPNAVKTTLRVGDKVFIKSCDTENIK